MVAAKKPSLADLKAKLAAYELELEAERRNRELADGRAAAWRTLARDLHAVRPREFTKPDVQMIYLRAQAMLEES